MNMVRTFERINSTSSSTTISDLSYELICKILSYVEEKDTRRIRLISKGFNKWFKSEKGLSLCINNWNYSIFCYQSKRFEKFSKLKLSDLTIELKNLQLNTKLCVTSLEFHRIVVPNNILVALANFSNLKILTFSSIFMEANPKSLREISNIKLPHLTKITMCSKTGDNSKKDMNFQWSDDARLPDDEEILLQFLSHLQYDRLSSVNLFCSNTVLESQPLEQLVDSNCSIKEMSPLTRLLVGSRKTLKKFSGGVSQYEISISIIFKPWDSLVKRGMRMEHFSCYLNIPLEWNKIFESQSTLKYLRLNGAYRHWTAVHVGIKRCQDVLTSVHLAGGGFNSCVDLSGFDKCSKLNCLEILLDDCYMKNVHCIPSTVRFLYLTGPLKYEDLMTIANKLENLVDFSVQDNMEAKHSSTYGDHLVIPANINTQLLTAFLSLPRIQQLTFDKCRIEFNNVLQMLKAVPRIQAEYFPIKGYHYETHGILKIQVPHRKLNFNDI